MNGYDRSMMMRNGCTGVATPGGGLSMESRSPWVKRWVLVVGFLSIVACLLPAPVIANETGQVTTITQVNPNKLQKTMARTLSLMIDNLPSMEGSLQCVFNFIGIKRLIVKAKRTAQGVTCTTPRTDFIPDIPHNEDHIVAALSVRQNEGPEFVTTNFTFFDCNTYSSCTECVSSPFPCDWCVDGHRCTHDTRENCRNDIIVNGINRIGPSIRSGPSYCSRITFIESPEILVPSGISKSIQVKVENIALFITQTRFVCQFNIEGRVTSVNAQLLSDTMYCDAMDFEYTTAAPSINATFAVIWGGSRPLDNPDNIHVTMYQCHMMADNCDMCMSLPEHFRCGWCQSSGRCEVADICGSWLERNQTCPNIFIIDFHPKSGPWEGGTNVTITGVNVGKEISDIYEGISITVAGMFCQPHKESYVKTRNVTCTVDSPGVNEFKQGPIVVKVAEGGRGESVGKFQFVNPEITSLWPRSGPKSGGTTLRIIGRYLNAGSRITASISGIPCIIQRTNDTKAICITTASNNLCEGKVEMQFDNGKRTLEGKYYEYVEGPEIVSVKSGRPCQAEQISEVNVSSLEDSLFIVEQYKDLESEQFTRLTVDKNTGTVYIGGINHLYQLDADLKLLHHVVMGPVHDSLECSANGCGDGSNVKITDNVNKVLVIDYIKSRLIVCGTVHQGSCQVRDLRNISVLDRSVLEPIVANNDTASTVAFIGPGPPSPPTTHVLYIGVTYTGTSVYRHEVPAIASRSLEDDRFFEIAVKKVTTSTRMYLNSLARERYPITYVHGFGSEKFSYFLTRQAESTHRGAPIISKLVRVCQNDSDYFSYTEIPIECKDSAGKHYNLVQAAYVGKPGTDLAAQLGIQTNDDVLFAVFSPFAVSSTSSALCVYSMKSVRRMFIQNIQNCFRGRGERGLNFISPSHRCIETNINDLNEDFCGMDVNTPLGGKQPVEAVAVLTFNEQLTAVAATSTELDTVVFLGTADGHLKKVVIEDENNALEYGDIVVDQNSPVRQDMHFDKAGDHIYIMTSNKVSKVKTKDCTIYKGCNQCLAARDPYCGWCSQENKCSLRKDCPAVTQNPQHCPTITQVMPSMLQRTTARTLSLEIDNFPSVEGALQCVFSAIGKDLIVKAKRTAQGVTCTTPRNDFLPDIPQNENHFVAALSVRQNEGPKFVTTNFTFYDCNTYSSCTECVSSPFPCDWCVDGHRCTHDSAENCRNDILVNGVNRVGPSIRSGPSFCPRITFIESPEILVSSGTSKSIKVKVDNIAQFITQTRFVCQYNIEGRVTSVNANLLSDTIYCDRMEFEYTTAAPSINATFAVIWGGSKPFDNPDNIHVHMYKCHQMADNCGMCLSHPERFHCGWCQSSVKCEVADQCNGPASQSWLERNETCPNIMITDFHPKTGPWEGGTDVTITGVNLGKEISDIYEITVAGFTCQPIKESYVKTKEVTCTVESVAAVNEGPIIVKVAEGYQLYQVESSEKYQFVNPEITSLWPRSGPKSGGTTLHIIGHYLNAGSRITASISGRPCIIQRINATEATCITTASDNLFAGKVEMWFDEWKRTLKGQYYEYVEDP